jgi:DNA-binding transcriptional ArsR family regulator
MLESLRRFKAGVFRAMAHPTRIGVLEQLRLGELSVGQLCERLEIEQANASQHLAVLRSRHLVETRKDGNQIFYRLRDPLIGEMLESLRQFYLSHMKDTWAMFQVEEEIESATPRTKRPKKARSKA